MTRDEGHDGTAKTRQRVSAYN